MKRRNDSHSPGPVIRELVPTAKTRSGLNFLLHNQRKMNFKNHFVLITAIIVGPLRLKFYEGFQICQAISKLQHVMYTQV